MVKSQTDTTRESMWSVSSRFRPLHGVVFFGLFAFGIYYDLVDAQGLRSLASMCC